MSNNRVFWDSECQLARLDGKSASLSRTASVVFRALAARPGVVQSSADLVGVLYADRRNPPETAHNVVCNAISQIRRALRGIPLETRWGVGWVIDLTGEQQR